MAQPIVIGDTPAPNWLISGSPSRQVRRFHSLDIEVYLGQVERDELEGWAGNPRFEMLAQQFEARYSRGPTNEEMYELVLADEKRKEGPEIRALASDIYRNGLKEPLVVTYDKRLLDGNRRYYACMFLAVEGAPKDERKRFTLLPVYVLPKGVNKPVEDAILTEFNFAPNKPLDWPYYVKAKHVYEDRADGMSKEDLYAKYGVKWQFVSKWIDAYALCQRFLDYHESGLNALDFAYRNFIMFDEMMRNYGKLIMQDAEFQEATFRLLLADYPDNPRCSASSDVIRLDDLWRNSEAWDAFASKRGPQALREALTILSVGDLDAAPDPDPRLRRVLSGLDRLIKDGAITAADPSLLKEFHQLAEKVPGAPQEANAQIAKMNEWLDNMAARDIAGLKLESAARLIRAMELVRAMHDAANKTDGGGKAQ